MSIPDPRTVAVQRHLPGIRDPAQLAQRVEGITPPPPRLWVCSTAIARVGTTQGASGRTIPATTSGSSWAPTGGQVREVTPPYAAAAPISYVTTCASASQSSSAPGGTSSCRAIWLAIDPLGQNSAASCPNIAATSASNAPTVGSSP
ncbi:hypothetical protein GCM10029963_67230 [Micromonospora andamanensis]